MTNEEQNIAIAEACGLLNRPSGEVVEYRRPEPQGNNSIFERVKFPDGSVRPCYRYNLPSYTTDLHAMHEAEKILFELNNWSACEYEKRLHEITTSWTWHATAAQRAEAFLRTIGKWKD